jgi:hypothetical protein
MFFRSMVALVAVCGVFGCESRSDCKSTGTCPDGTGGGGGSSGTGAGTGTGGGMAQVDGGNMTSDGGVRTFTTVADARKAKYCVDKIELTQVVVTAVDSANPTGTRTFWIADKADSKKGLYVFIGGSDMVSYVPAVGDVLNIKGYLGTVQDYFERIGRRQQLRSGCSTTSAIKIQVEKTGTQSPLPDNPAPAGFGTTTDGGTYGANRELESTRVSIPGPLTLSDDSPLVFRRITPSGNSSTAYGFEVKGSAVPDGILVNNYKTFGQSPTDGGTPRCDFRAIARDGGMVTFPNGISGVWDTYTNAPCNDDKCDRNDAGFVPGTDLRTTNVLYPLDCNDLKGEVK